MSGSRPKLYLFVGYPGAGKTTLAKFISSRTRAVHLWADQERQVMFNSPTHSLEESKQLYDVLDVKTEQLLKSGNSVVFDTNFNYHADRQLLRSIASKYHADTQIIWLTTPLEVARERALHHSHRDRNGYELTMSEAEFNRLTNHLEAPSDDEQPYKVDGTKLDLEQIARDLNI